jgi:FkbM family methyltransferase
VASSTTGGDTLNRPSLGEVDVGWVDTYRRMKSPVRPFVRRHWRHPVVAGSARTARRWLAVYDNNDHDLQVNGEAEVVRRLAHFGVRQVVDVGGFEGDWTALVRAELPDAEVDCFEASPGMVEELQQRFTDDPRVRVHGVALGPEAGESTLYVHQGHASLTSLVPSDPELTRPVQVRVECGDHHLERAGIDRLDLLKVDAEGYDLEVLRGFGHSLAAGRIRVVQFEYNTWNIRSRSLLADFYELLEPHGYLVGKVHPDGVDLRPYGFELENWVGPACIAVHGSEPELVQALRCRGPR